MYNHAVVLTSGTITCTSSEQGYLLDFVVCDRTMVPWLKVDLFHNVPWKPHLALRVEVAVPKQPIWIRTQIMPPKFDLPRLTQKQRQKKLADEGASMDATWLVAKDKGTAGQSWSYGASPFKMCLPYVVHSDKAEALGMQYGKFMLVAEHFFLMGQQEDDGDLGEHCEQNVEAGRLGVSEEGSPAGAKLTGRYPAQGSKRAVASRAAGPIFRLVDFASRAPHKAQEQEGSGCCTQGADLQGP